ncbi:MAG TPA: cytochrome c biogenesis protein ResB [Candidatus Krumholzibacteria bacterium]|nr:cytochrome c biogenesis protein ResB [Candidatus Krumholzibacteria bacterium]
MSGSPIRALIKPLASLRLTVALLACSIFLIFAGTWAQIDMGIWTTLGTYFRAFFVWIPFRIFLPRHWDVPGGIPFPGGWVIGGLLMINLVTAHAVRFRYNRKRAGILLIHFGLILLLVGELVTGLKAHESRMSIDEGQTVDFAEDTRSVELVIIDPSDPARDWVVAIPESRLHQGKLIHDTRLPFDVQVEAYFHNAELFEGAQDVATSAATPVANSGFAVELGAHARPRPPSSGVDQDEIDLPAAYVSVLKDGRNLGTYLAALYFTLVPRFGLQDVQVGDKTYRMALRYVRHYKPYSISLLDFKHDRYLGTETPRNFSSHIRLVDPTHNENREVLIYMNNPLRYRGETFYQASFKQGDGGTVLQVVRNPGWLLPYVACTVGALGMMLQFGTHLLRFIRRTRTA